MPEALDRSFHQVAASTSPRPILGTWNGLACNPSLMRDLATITRNTIQPKFPGAKPFIKTTLPTTFQRRVFTLLQMPPP